MIKTYLWVADPQLHVAAGDTMKSRPKGGFVIQCLDARLRGHDGMI
jgi:hypothetical protein